MYFVMEEREWLIAKPLLDTYTHRHLIYTINVNCTIIGIIIGRDQQLGFFFFVKRDQGGG